MNENWKEAADDLLRVNKKAQLLEPYNNIGFAVHSLLLQQKEVTLQNVIAILENPVFLEQTGFIEKEFFPDSALALLKPFAHTA